MKNCIYRFLNKNNEIIYIGKAKNLKQRLNNHTHLPKECYEEKDRIEYIKFNSEDDMDFAERYFIQKINPKYNTILSDKSIHISCEELENKEWLDYDNPNKDSSRNSLKEKIKKYKEIEKEKKILFHSEEENTEEENEYMKQKLDECYLEQEKLENEIIKISKKPYWIVRMFIKEGLSSEEEIINKHINDLKEKYYENCKKQLEQNGYYKFETFEYLERDFISTNSKGHESKKDTEVHLGGGDWLHLLKGEFKHISLQKYFVDEEIKNKLIDEIVYDVENRLEKEFGRLKETLIFIEVDSCWWAKAFYPYNTYRKIRKPFICKKIIA